jgi:hypothetical protein
MANEIQTTIKTDVVAQAQVEKLALTIYDLRQKIKALQKNEKALVSQLYDIGILTHSDPHKETVTIGQVVLTKTPSVQGFDLQGIRKLADDIGISRKEVINKEWRFTANKERLATLVEEGKLSQEAIDECTNFVQKLYVKPVVKA